MSDLGLEDVLHDPQAGVGVEVARLLGHDLDAAVRAPRLDLVGEALGAVLGDRDPREALDLHDVALALELVGDVVGREDADLVVVAEDRRRGGVRGGEQAVDVHDRDAGPLGLPGDGRQRRAVLGQHDEGVGLLGDGLLDLLRLRVGVGGLEQLEVDVRVLLGLRPGRSWRWRPASRGRWAARWR